MRLSDALARGDALTTTERLRCWTTTALALQLVALAVLVLGTHGLITKLDRPCTTDFVSFYAAGLLADGQHPALVYDRAAHFLAEQATVAPGISYVHFFYPPVFVLLCGMLAHLPYLAAFVLFEVVTTGACLLVLRLISASGWRECVISALSFSPLLWNVGFGQNACLTASLFGFGTLLLHRHHQVAAGLVLSCLLFKPHTALLIPIALAAGGSWRAFFAAAGGVTALGLLSASIFGADEWTAFAHTIEQANRAFAAGGVVPFVTMASMFGAARLLGAPPSIAYDIECAVTIAVILALIWIWRQPDDRTGIRYAVLSSGVQLVMPVVLFYDTVLLLVAGAWLLRAMRLTGALRGERAGLCLLWVCGLLCYPLTRATHVPIAAAMGLILFSLLMARAIRRRASLQGIKEELPLSVGERQSTAQP